MVRHSLLNSSLSSVIGITLRSQILIALTIGIKIIKKKGKWSR